MHSGFLIPPHSESIENHLRIKECMDYIYYALEESARCLIKGELKEQLHL